MKLKKSSLQQVEAAGQAGQTGGAFISQRLRNPAEGRAARPAAPADTAGLICAIIATLILAAITAMLYMHWDLIKTA